MDDPERRAGLVASLVSGMEPVQRLRDDRGRERHRHAFALREHEPREGRERVALDVLHDDEQLVLLGDDVERGNDVGMTDHRGEPRLVEEHGDELGVARVAVV